jgi:hypothetical protein
MAVVLTVVRMEVEAMEGAAVAAVGMVVVARGEEGREREGVAKEVEAMAGAAMAAGAVVAGGRVEEGREMAVVGTEVEAMEGAAMAAAALAVVGRVEEEREMAAVVMVAVVPTAVVVKAARGGKVAGLREVESGRCPQPSQCFECTERRSARNQNWMQDWPRV